MPWINRPKTERSTSDSFHRDVYNRQRWKKLRQAYLQKHPLCEMCLSRGLSVLAEEVHHKIELKRGRTAEDRAQLAFDWGNLQALCRECHHDVHRKLRSGDKKNKKNDLSR